MTGLYPVGGPHRNGPPTGPSLSGGRRTARSGERRSNLPARQPAPRSVAVSLVPQWRPRPDSAFIAFIAAADLDEIPDEEGLGVDAAAVAPVQEVVSTRRPNTERDRSRKRREYARAGIPVYMIIDGFDEDGSVRVLTTPHSGKARDEDEHHVPYGTDAVVPSGPAKRFTVGEAVPRA